MAVQRFQFSETIHAPASVVWEVMLGERTFGEWVRPFAEGCTFEGKWEKGSPMRFLIPPGDGMLSEIADCRPHEFVSIRHLGNVRGGVTDTESDEVKAWAPAYENYTFESVPGGTRVVVDQDFAPEYEESMRKTWRKALALLKGMCEGRPQA